VVQREKVTVQEIFLRSAWETKIKKKKKKKNRKMLW